MSVTRDDPLKQSQGATQIERQIDIEKGLPLQLFSDWEGL